MEPKFAKNAKKQGKICLCPWIFSTLKP
jgi:hypothetical protein